MRKEKQQMEMRLTRHFTLGQLVRCGCAITNGIDNLPSAEQTERLRLLCENVLEPLWSRFGAIRVVSGYRCRRLDACYDGLGRHDHGMGEAADLHISSMEVGWKMFCYIRDRLDFDELYFENLKANGCCWLHVSYTSRRDNRRHAEEPEGCRSVNSW